MLAILVVTGSFFFDWKTSWISSLNQLPTKLFSSNHLQEKLAALEKENKNLKAELFIQELKQGNPIKVYSSHPFSNRGEIVIAAGKNQGIKTGDVVTYGPNILVGKVTKVFDSKSIVITIFDPSWRVAARIGRGETDALMEGGNELMLTLIPQEAKVAEGEEVFTAGPDLPYGLVIGRVKSITTVSGGAFKEGVLDPSFELKRLRDVDIYR